MYNFLLIHSIMEEVSFYHERSIILFINIYILIFHGILLQSAWIVLIIVIYNVQNEHLYYHK